MTHQPLNPTCRGWINTPDFHIVDLAQPEDRHLWCDVRVNACLTKAMEYTGLGKHIVVVSNTGTVYYDDDQPDVASERLAALVERLRAGES